jgi:hypothetical protein
MSHRNTRNLHASDPEWLHYQLALPGATISSTRAEVERLAGLFAAFRPRIHASSMSRDPERGWRLVLDPTFLAYLGPCPEALLDCYGHKWVEPADVRRF